MRNHPNNGYPIAGYPLPRRLAAVLSTIALFAVVAALVTLGQPGTQPTVRVSDPGLYGAVEQAVSHACSTEDSVNCYWNARTRGNHKGHSFYSIRVGEEACVFYWNSQYGRRHNHC